MAIADAHAVLHGDRAGGTVIAADLDADGRDEVVLGMGDGPSSGAVLVARSAADGRLDPVATWGGLTAGDHAGYALAAGDLDGDGDRDLLVGAYGADLAAEDGGATFPLVTPFDGGPLPSDLAFADPSAGDQAGVGVAVLGDGVAVGACMEDSGGEDAGAVFVGPAGLTSPAASTAFVVGEHPGDFAGANVAAADVDGDGVDDLLVSAWLEDAGGEDAGAAYLLLGRVDATVSLADADAKLVGETAGDFAGSPCDARADLTGDGTPDLVLGAWLNDTGGADAGSVYVVSGTVRGLLALADADAIVRGDEPGAHLAVVPAGAGDVDRDGQEDLLVGAPDAAGSAGAAWLVYGPVGGAYLEPDVRIHGGEAGERAGVGVALGDLDGDATGDLVIGLAAGAAAVFYGARL
ncbi:MAG: FG-GAP-like repeat-containing protein [Myxococcota bacterium]